MFLIDMYADGRVSYYTPALFVWKGLSWDDVPKEMMENAMLVLAGAGDAADFTLPGVGCLSSHYTIFNGYPTKKLAFKRIRLW